MRVLGSVLPKPVITPHQCPAPSAAPALRGDVLAAAVTAASARVPLEEIWAHSVLAAVTDRDLANGIDQLMQYHLRVDFFEDRMEGMRSIPGFGYDGEMVLALCPNRFKVRDPGSAPKKGKCVLCSPPIAKERGLSWRDWRVWPNAFPYVPAEMQHIVITPREHRPQSGNPEVRSIIDFQRAANAGRPMTMHFNGIAGNSQPHLHWQATRVQTPLEKALDAGRLKPEVRLQRHDGRVSSYDSGSFAGFLLEGSKEFVSLWADRMVAEFNNNPLTQGAYNMVMLPSHGSRVRLSIVPRRASNLRPVLGSLGRCSVGALHTAGFLVAPMDEVPSDFHSIIGAAIRSTIVPPSEFSWIDNMESLAPLALPCPVPVLTH